MRILSIGNSFSVDAQRYLHGVAKAAGVELKCANLYIGGCSLETHYKNIMNDSYSYNLQFNGEMTGFMVSVKQALLADEWDVITLQQVSTLSTKFKSYSPYIKAIADYVRFHRPGAKLMVHQTWGYEDGSERLKKMKYPTMEAMLDKARLCYKKWRRRWEILR